MVTFLDEAFSSSSAAHVFSQPADPRWHCDCRRRWHFFPVMLYHSNRGVVASKHAPTHTRTNTHTDTDTTGDARLPQSLQGRKHSLALTAGFGDALPIRSSLLLKSLFSLSPITYLGSMLRARSINGCCCSCPPLSPKSPPRSLSSRSTKPHAGILQQQEDDMIWKELSQLIRQQEKST